MNVAEAAREIGLCADAVYELCRTGQLPHRRIGPNRGRIQIDAAHIAAYMARCEVSEPPRLVARRPRKPSVPGRPDGQPLKHIRKRRE